MAVIRVSKLGWGWTPFSQMDRAAPLGPNETILGEARVLIRHKGWSSGGTHGGVRLTDRRLILNQDRGLPGALLTEVPRPAVIEIVPEPDHRLIRGRTFVMLRLRTSTGEEELRLRFLNRLMPHASLLAQARALYFPAGRAATEDWLAKLDCWLPTTEV
jgi:hypothetical protein